MKTLDLAKELIGFKTVSPVEDPDIFEFVKLYLEDEGIDVEIREINGVFNLVAETGEGERSVCLNGHVDVVPPGEDWEVTEPFKPLVKNGKLYGRGAADMKTGVAGLVNAFISLHNDPEFEDRATLMIVGDEEVGGENGSKALVEKIYGEGKGFDYVIVGEPTNLDLQVGTRGVAWFNIYIKGEEIHATRADKAENVMKKLPEVLEELNSLEMRYDNQTPLPDPSSEVTLVETNDTYNSIPGQLKIGMDVRYLPSQSMEKIGQDIEKALEKLDVNYEIELEKDHGGANMLRDKKFERIALEELAKVREDKPSKITEGGASDGRFFFAEGTPVVEIGVNKDQGHKEDEYCTVQNVRKLDDIYYNICKRLLETEN